MRRFLATLYTCDAVSLRAILELTPADYVRAARRIRARGNAATIHSRLRQLNAIADHAVGDPGLNEIDLSRSNILAQRPTASGRFARRVAERLVCGLLPWTDRQILVAQAAAIGIGRFEANLLIAAVQHAVPARSIPAPAAEQSSVTRRWATLTTFLLLQSVIIAVVWRYLL